MVAIVYSGSKTAFWKLTKNGIVVAHCNTTGLNPCFVDRKTILQILNKKVALVNHAEEIKKIYFFAAGASSHDRKEELANTLSSFFKFSKVIVEDDLFGAAKAVCFDKTGIVGMIGNGANCAYFDGKKPIKNNFGLGYILGDEGSANYLGKMLLKNHLTKKLPQDLETKFNSAYGLDRPQILEKIYNKPQANNFLSSFFDFILQHKDHGYIIGLVDEGFEKYLKKYTIPMALKYKDEELHFVGIVASEFEERLRVAAAKHQLTIKTIIKEPIHNLLKHFTN
ncbi:N-acetylglucosamine kinase-like BadF-type ATPase [Pedobacter sp. UYEF25]